MKSIMDPELAALKDKLMHMLSLVITQIEKCREAVRKIDEKSAEEVIENEKKVNAQELEIDQSCENILALYTPVAVDLRFVLSALMMSKDLERIGDHMNDLALFVKRHGGGISKKHLEEFKLDKMLEIISYMLEAMRIALKDKDSEIAREALKKDLELNDINKKALKTADGILKGHLASAKIVLRLFSLVRILERAGDLTKNIGEEIVFYLEAEVLKHKT